MDKGSTEPIGGLFSLIFAFIIIVVGAVIIVNFTGSSAPERNSFNDFAGKIEAMCAESRASTTSSFILNLPRSGEKGKIYSKIHMSDSKAELMYCEGLGAGCSNAGTNIKTKQINCPTGIRLDDCWINAPNETIVVTIKKDSNQITLEEGEGVYCGID